MNPFHPNAQRYAKKDAELLLALVSLCRVREEKKVLRSLSQVFFSIDSSSHEEALKSLSDVQKFIETHELDMVANHPEVIEIAKTSRLKSLWMMINDVFNGRGVSYNAMETLFEAMTWTPPKFIKEELVWITDPKVITDWQEDLKIMAEHFFINDGVALRKWRDQITDEGYQKTCEDPKWGDKKIGKRDKFKGMRRIRLSYSGRVIYKVSQRINKNASRVKTTIEIVKITSDHDYS